MKTCGYLFKSYTRSNLQVRSLWLWFPAAAWRQANQLPPHWQKNDFPAHSFPPSQGLEAQSALASLQEIDASVSKDQSSADGIAHTLLDLTNEIDARFAGDTRLVTTSLSIDLRYWLKLTWQNFGDSLLLSAHELTQDATRRPLGSLRVISLHLPMFERRTCRVLEFLAFLWWLNMVLNFFGLY